LTSRARRLRVARCYAQGRSAQPEQTLLTSYPIIPPGRFQRTCGLVVARL